MNRTTIVASFLWVLVAAAGCEKSSDLGRMHDEAIGIADEYAPRVDALQRRILTLAQRGRMAQGPSQKLAEAGNAISHARHVVDSILHRHNETAPSVVDVASKSTNPDDLQKVIDELQEQLDKDILIGTAGLDAVDSSLAAAETRPADPAP